VPPLPRVNAGGDEGRSSLNGAWAHRVRVPRVQLCDERHFAGGSAEQRPCPLNQVRRGNTSATSWALAESEGEHFKGSSLRLGHDTAVSLFECLHDVKGVRWYRRSLLLMRSGPARGSVIPVRIGDRSAGTYIRPPVRTLHPSLHLGRHPQAVPAHVAGIERAAELQRLPYRHRQCRHVVPGRAHPSAAALGPDSAPAALSRRRAITNGRTRRTASSRTISRAPTVR
jgi:hypothetical protein